MVLNNSITLIPFTENDFPQYKQLMTDQSLLAGLQLQADELLHAFENDLNQFSFNQIVYQGTCIGCISCYQIDDYTLDIAYGIQKNYRKKGLMTKALKQQLSLLPRSYTLQAEMLADNIASKNLVNQLDFTEVTQFINPFGQHISIYQLDLI